MFSLYVHIPYCLHKCPYCDFNVHVASPIPEQEYTKSLIQELNFHGGNAEWSGNEIETIYLGGGTPSLFSPASCHELLAAARNLFPVAAGAEITMEANPATLSRGYLENIRKTGINRISLGAQSFNPGYLRLLGRDHGPEQICEAAESLIQAGFDNYSIDLMFALPGQGMDEFGEDLRKALRLGPTHLSTYSLTYEKGTRFFRWKQAGLLEPCEEELEVTMMEKAEEMLKRHGFVHYEVSNHALPGMECRHSVNTWKGKSYLGIGAGAHSYVQVGPAGLRWINERAPGQYMRRVKEAGKAFGELEALSPRQSMEEAIFLGLRMRDGIDMDGFWRRFGRQLFDSFPTMPLLASEGFLTHANGFVSVTRRGMLVLDEVISRLIE